MSTQLKVAKEIIERITYLNIASITPEGKPWNTPVYCSLDSDLNFYWVSWKENQHSVNVRTNPNIFATIYDSTQPAGTGVGIYLEGKASELSNIKEVFHALKCHYGRERRTVRDVVEFLSKLPRRAYKFVPEKAWINIDDTIDGNFVDKRAELDLQKLKNLFK